MTDKTQAESLLQTAESCLKSWQEAQVADLYHLLNCHGTAPRLPDAVLAAIRVAKNSGADLRKARVTGIEVNSRRSMMALDIQRNTDQFGAVTEVEEYTVHLAAPLRDQL